MNLGVLATLALANALSYWSELCAQMISDGVNPPIHQENLDLGRAEGPL